ncbi:MAG: hypothetical protein V7K50_06095 [Nostoc sp.]|uniref:hypothetical protein n=1 Tax=Nostoc sp. TaxID=1180 RepID=UPI002FFB9817
MSISPNRLKELQNIPDTTIDTSDIPELDQQFWETAKMVKCVSPLAIAESVVHSDDSRDC